MPSPNEKLAASLAVLHALQKTGRRVFRSRELSRVHRERLVRQGFLREVIKGWLISSSPNAQAGDSTPWYASFWEFCARYCEARFGDQWRLSPEQSLLLHAENAVVPSQLIVSSPGGGNNRVELLFGTSLYDRKESHAPAAGDLTVRDRLRLLAPAAALVRVSEAFFKRHPVEARLALAGIPDPTEVLGRLLDGGHSVVAGRLAGAFRHIGRSDDADAMVRAMTAAGYTVRESDPFADPPTLVIPPAPAPPLVRRIETLWQAMRARVIEIFPAPPDRPANRDAYLRQVDEIYRHDAYHSLSIEGYVVSPGLIERVGAGGWDPDRHAADRQDRDALAARGYWQAFQRVRQDVSTVIAGAGAGQVVRANLNAWYREVFEPSVAAGLIAPSALAGYRRDAVYLRTSRYVPPRWEAVRDAMPALFDRLENEPAASVGAVLGHWMLGYIHPYPDGNGRMARLLMNVMLSSGGYPWTIIRVEDRTPYLDALDRASIDLDIAPFASFIAERARSSMPPQTG